MDISKDSVRNDEDTHQLKQAVAAEGEIVCLNVMSIL